MGMFGAMPNGIQSLFGQQGQFSQQQPQMPQQMASQPNQPYPPVQTDPYTPPKLSTMQKLGLAGDILKGSDAIGSRLQEQQKEQYLQQQQQAQYQDAWKQWVAQQQYKAANPDPVAPTEVQKNYDWLKANHPEVADQYLQAQTTAPPIVQHNSDSTITLYQAGMIPRGGSGIPTAPVGKLTPIQGGAGPSQAPQGFPLYPAR